MMFKFTEFVDASSIWPTAENHTDKGERAGLLRGYNVEVVTRDGKKTFWKDCEWIHGTPERNFNDDFHAWCYVEHGYVPTGRICFRGYAIEEYDFEERDTYVVPVKDDEV